MADQSEMSHEGDKQKTETTYDIFPYESYPIEKSRPEYLHTIGRLFGMAPPDFQRCRVLELGCASGGNLIPMAEVYPDSHFTGLDLSARQVKAGQAQIKALELKNVTIEKMSILDIEADFGRFDYIIAHGVYSWVPPEVQTKILEICQQNLNENGIAYVSYNTLPGWNMVQNIRDMMRYHVRNISDPVQSVAQAKSMMQFIHDGVKDGSSPYSLLMKTELDRILHAQDNHIYHDHLEEENHPCYFFEFMDQARQYNLDYLADTDISTMLLTNFSKDIVSKLKGVKDIVKIEQYMDFLRDRRFRSTLLCHQSQKLSRDIKSEAVSGFHLASPVTLKEGQPANVLDDGISAVFKLPHAEVKVSNRIAKLAMKVLADQKQKPISFEDLCQEVFELSPDTPLSTIKETVISRLNPLDLAFKGVIELHSSPGIASDEHLEKPRVFQTARYLAKTKDVLPNMRHQTVRLNAPERILLGYLDGEHSMEELVACLRIHVEKGEMNLNSGNEAVTDEEQIKAALSEFVRLSVQKMADNALLY